MRCLGVLGLRALKHPTDSAARGFTVVLENVTCLAFAMHLLMGLQRCVANRLPC